MTLNLEIYCSYEFNHDLFFQLYTLYRECSIEIYDSNGTQLKIFYCNLITLELLSVYCTIIDKNYYKCIFLGFYKALLIL